MSKHDEIYCSVAKRVDILRAARLSADTPYERWIMSTRKRSMLLAIVLVGLFVLTGIGPAQAATTYGPGGVSGASIKMSPTSLTVRRTSQATLKIAVDTKAHTSSVYQFGIGFDTTRLSCASIQVATDTGFPFEVAKQCDGTYARFAAAVPIGAPPFHGKAFAATVVFKPTGKLGSTTLTFDPAITMVVNAPDATNVTGAMNTAQVRIVN